MIKRNESRKLSRSRLLPQMLIDPVALTAPAKKARVGGADRKELLLAGDCCYRATDATMFAMRPGNTCPGWMASRMLLWDGERWGCGCGCEGKGKDDAKATSILAPKFWSFRIALKLRGITCTVQALPLRLKL